MVLDPSIEERPAQAYVGVRRVVTMATMNEIADRIPEIIGSLIERGVAIAGAPFLRYLRVDTAGEVEVEAGVPVAASDVEEAAVLPAGRYVTITHVGHPDGLTDLTAAVLAWGDELSLDWDVEDGLWGARVERFLTNPMEEPDPARWRTELAIRLAGQP
ncbi:effector-binding domain-containing protein [Actinokineospora alba]|uniref:Effector-binding domain-containing protein n=1 Tax=Actinokineospora alba TaxID=504798 RepID=A0A1H0JNE2_9PSEU|nr:GyrI-like domain-containing protein [Actinokineospora alba]TDP68235.1 effector-binding domain-containing protein [Actinokineospora alba]SDH94833.1 effector-binding domain-containing protein [Actinokineospora alba]SDO44989.1 effector-binding domain-containing protein [Actinokineospora alba]